MSETTADSFRARLKQEVDTCIENHDVLRVRRKKGGSFVVIGEDDWKAIEETLFLNRIPGFVDSIRSAAKERLSKGTKLKDLKW